MRVDNPLKWLLSQLPNYVPEHLLPVLLRTYEVNKRAYERQIKIRAAERTIKAIQSRKDSRDAAKLARWHAKLAKLKEEQWQSRLTA